MVTGIALQKGRNPVCQQMKYCLKNMHKNHKSVFYMPNRKIIFKYTSGACRKQGAQIQKMNIQKPTTGLLFS